MCNTSERLTGSISAVSMLLKTYAPQGSFDLLELNLKILRFRNERILSDPVVAVKTRDTWRRHFVISAHGCG